MYNHGATHAAITGPLQLEIANVAIDMRAGQAVDNQQVIYVDVRWRDAVFRTTGQTRKFDPLAPRDAPLKFEVDRGLLTVAPPFAQADDELVVSVRRCQMFGDTEMHAVSCRVGDLPLTVGVERAIRIDCFVMHMRPLNFGLPADGADALPDTSQNGEWPAADFTSLSQPQLDAATAKGKAAKKRKGKKEKGPQAMVPPGLEGDGEEATGATAGDLYADADGDDAEEEEQTPAAPSRPTPPPPAPTTGAASPSNNSRAAPAVDVAPRSLTGEAVPAPAPSEGVAERSNASGPPPGSQPMPMVAALAAWGDPAQSLQIVRHADSLGTLTYTGAFGATDVPPRRTPGYLRCARLRTLLAPAAAAPNAVTVPTGMFGGFFSVVSQAVKQTASDMANTVDVELMRSHFPDIRSPLVTTFKPHVLNGHGVPIEGVLYVTPAELAFHGPLLRFVVPYADVALLRRLDAFSKDALQLFVASGAVVYQLQDFDGVLSRLQSAVRTHRESKFLEAWRMIVDLWLNSRGE
jgi:hypothetical protein